MAEPTTAKSSFLAVWSQDLAHYLRHVWRHWRTLVIGGVGGFLMVLALFTSINIPLWLGVTIVIVGLSVAQFLAFRDMKQERDELHKASEVSIGSSPFPRSPLERAVVASLVAAQKVERERLVQGDAGLFDRLAAWAGETDERLRKAEAGKLHAQFRQGGFQPPHETNELVAYLKRQMRLLERALRQLRRDERPGDSDDPAAVVDRVALLRQQYQRGRALQAAPPGVSGSAAASRAEVQEEKARKLQATFQWAEPTWELLREHFAPREDDFCPCAVRWGYGSFHMAFHEEVDAVGSADAYLEQKMALLGDFLREHDS